MTTFCCSTSKKNGLFHGTLQIFSASDGHGRQFLQRAGAPDRHHRPTTTLRGDQGRGAAGRDAQRAGATEGPPQRGSGCRWRIIMIITVARCKANLCNCPGAKFCVKELHYVITQCSVTYLCDACVIQVCQWVLCNLAA